MIRVYSYKPVATDSWDHIAPHGTARDNSVNALFNARLYELFGPYIVRLLDLGCAGGGLVKSILDDGGTAVGIEGSDYNQRHLRAEWATIPRNLFTADITEPFIVGLEDESHTSCPIPFHVVTAWEVFEHIREIKIAAVVSNIKRHLGPGGFFVGSISPDPHEPYHVTIQSKDWWLARFVSLGMRHAPDMEEHFAGAMVRDIGFPIALRAA